ncbi:unnamed protein product [Malus baccata var. baccata]
MDWRCFCTAAPRPWLFVGLGNPGDKYKGTRHNMIDAFAGSQGIVMNTVQCKAILGQGDSGKFVISGFVGEVPVFLAKPQTYMNLSGESTRPLAAYYKLSLNRVLFPDDMTLPCGVLCLYPNGGHVDHNGFGDTFGCHGYGFSIGRPSGQMDPKAFLLQKFNATAQRRLKHLTFSKGFAESARCFNSEQKYKHPRLETLPT